MATASPAPGVSPRSGATALASTVLGICPARHHTEQGTATVQLRSPPGPGSWAWQLPACWRHRLFPAPHRWGLCWVRGLGHGCHPGTEPFAPQGHPGPLLHPNPSPVAAASAPRGPGSSTRV